MKFVTEAQGTLSKSCQDQFESGPTLKHCTPIGWVDDVGDLHKVNITSYRNISDGDLLAVTFNSDSQADVRQVLELISELEDSEFRELEDFWEADVAASGVRLGPERAN